MPDHSVSQVLESVADVSAKRDIANLRRSLLQTLTELLPMQDARFCPLGSGADARGPFNLRIDAAMVAALRGGQILTVDTAGTPRARHGARDDRRRRRRGHVVADHGVLDWPDPRAVRRSAGR